MNKESLLLFMKRILECGSESRSKASLVQLKEILEMQNADAEMIALVDQTLDCVSDAKDAAKREPELTEESLHTAYRRAEERRRREEEMMYRGRC